MTNEDKKLLEIISDSSELVGAYNIRRNGKSIERITTDEIAIVSKKDKEAKNIVLVYYTSLGLQRSSHDIACEHSKSSSQVSSTALFEDPAAGNTVSKRLIELSRYTSIPSGRSKGQTPPTACPVSFSASSCESIVGLNPNLSLNFLLSIL